MHIHCALRAQFSVQCTHKWAHVGKKLAITKHVFVETRQRNTLVLSSVCTVSAIFKCDLTAPRPLKLSSLGLEGSDFRRNPQLLSTIYLQCISFWRLKVLNLPVWITYFKKIAFVAVQRSVTILMASFWCQKTGLSIFDVKDFFHSAERQLSIVLYYMRHSLLNFIICFLKIIYPRDLPPSFSDNYAIHQILDA